MQKPPAHDSTPLYAKTLRFLTPARLRIRKPAEQIQATAYLLWKEDIEFGLEEKSPSHYWDFAVKKCTSLIGFGIGETIQIMYPNWLYCIPSYERWRDIPMPDGSTIDDIPDDVQFERVVPSDLSS